MIRDVFSAAKMDVGKRWAKEIGESKEQPHCQLTFFLRDAHDMTPSDFFPI